MNKQRRNFIKLTGGLAGGLILSPIACKVIPTDKQTINTADLKNLETFGLQLYTLREDMPKDPKGILKQVASFGYKEIESYEGPQGMFWGMSNKDFKAYVEDLGMTVVASHCNMNQDFEKKAAEAAAIGMKYLICPWLGPQKTLDDYRRYADVFNQKGEICKKNGIRFAYHNHAYSFKPENGVYPQALLMNGADPALVDFELDMYWVAAQSEDIEAWLKKYPNRFRLCHVKDRSKTPGTDDNKNSVDLGKGSINWPKVLHTAKETGMKYYIVEQEAYEGTTPLGAAEANAAYMKGVKI